MTRIISLLILCFCAGEIQSTAQGFSVVSDTSKKAFLVNKPKSFKEIITNEAVSKKRIIYSSPNRKPILI